MGLAARAGMSVVFAMRSDSGVVIWHSVPCRAGRSLAAICIRSQLAAGGIDAGQVTAITIVEVIDYH